VKVRTTKTTRYIEVTPVGKVWLERLKARERLLVPIVRPKRWDKKWRLILFDISAEERAKRNAFRGLIRRLGAVMFQKSVWAYPFDCSEQIKILTDIFGFSADELRLVIADSIGDDKELKVHFKLSD
jgi:DNA-binding transcriptional regulator PaaX